MDTENTEPTIEYTDEETGELVIKELAKEYLSKGAWQTMMFLYQDKNAKTGEWTEPKVSIRRYQKQQGVFKQRSKFQYFEQGTGQGDYCDAAKVVRALV